MKHNHGVIFLWIGAVVMMFLFSGCGRIEYDQYSSKDKKLNITMDCPKGWDFNEEHGAYGAYVQVIFLEPAQLNKPFRAMMVITIKDELKKKGVKPLTLAKLGNDLLEKRLALRDAKKISSRHFQFLGFNAGLIDFSYRLPDHPDRVDAQYVPMKERVVFFKRGSRFYILRYVNENRDFSRQEKAFTYCINTLKFKGAK